jgi:MFS family permease
MAQDAASIPGGLGGTARRIADRVRTIVRLELELARLELERKARALALGIGLAVGAAVFLLFSIGFALAGAAAGLATELPMWASLLIVSGGVLLVAGILGGVAAALLKEGAPPVPEQAIEEARLTADALRSNGHGV